MAAPPLNECRIAVGRVVLGLECPSAEYAASLSDYFAVGATDAEPDLRLRLEIVEHEDIPVVPDSLAAAKRPAPGGFAIEGDLVAGSFDPAARRGLLRVKWYLTKDRMTRVFEQLLYQAFYSARRLTGYDAVLVHSCGVLRGGAGYLFVGESGAGKSTVASLSGDAVVLNDEITLVEFGAGGGRLRGTPFNGHYRGKQPGGAPLRAVFLLAHGTCHRLEQPGPAAAAGQLTGQIVAPLGLEEFLSARTSLAMLDAAARLCQAAPVRRLLFTPDPGFWPVIQREFPAEAR